MCVCIRERELTIAAQLEEEIKQEIKANEENEKEKEALIITSRTAYGTNN